MNNMISKSQLRNALIKAKNEVGLDTVGIKVPVSGSTAKEIHDYLYNTFIDPENSSFAGRVKFVEKFIKHIIGERTGSNLSKEASEFLRKTLSVEQDRITPAIAIPAIGRLFTEPLLKDVPPGKVYAYITIQGRVEKVKQLSSEGHNSYNYAIEHIDKSMRNIINIVDGEHGSYYDNVIPVSGGKMDNSANTKSGVRSSGFTIAVYDHTGEISNKINEKVNASISPAKIDDFSDGGIASIYNKSNWAIVTGTRSVNGSYDSEKNIRANKNLKKELSKLGYKFIEANGVYKNVPDGPVYIVVGISERDAMDLGKKYGQESVLTRSGNMYSDGSMFNKSADNVFTGSEALSKDAYTILPDGSVFSLDLNFDESDPILSGGIDAKDSLLLLKENESLQKQDSVVNQVGSSVKESKMAPSEGRVLIPSNWDIDSDGNDFLFYHYGNIVGDTINPNYWGRSYYTSDKRHNGVSYYYTKSNQQEGMVGGDVHVVRVPKYKVYPFDIDPLGFRDFAQKDFEAKWPGYAFDEEQAIDFMNPLLEKAGFEMTVATWGPFPLRAETTKALKFDKKTSKTIREQGGIGPEFRKKKLELDIINKLHSASARPSRNKELIRDTFYSMGGSDINVNEAINNPTLSKAIGKKLIDEYKSIESSFKYSSDPGLKNVQMKGPKASLVGTRHSRLVLDKAKMLESAIRMEEAGSTQEDIFYATGFWRSFEGRWVMEISDYSASIKMLPAEGSVYKLDQIVGHETLYKIYPQLRDVVVTSEPFVEAPELVADFKSEDVRKIRINSLALEKLEEGDNVLTDIIHEIQHAIQDIEGLENGTSPYYSDGKYLEYQGLIKSWENAVSLMRSNPSLKGDPQFKSIWDNVEFLAGEISRFYAVKKMADGLQAKNGFTAGQSYYLLFHGEAVANIAEGSMGMTQKEIDATPFSLRHVVSDNNRVVDINTTISVMRAQVINNAFLSGSPSFGPGKELFIPESKASLQSGDVNQYLKNQKQAMGVSMKAAANYFSGINETPEEKEARKQLRDQISLEIMAAKLAYEMAQEEKAKALAYQKKELEIAHSFNMKDLADRLMEKMNRAIRREQADGAFRWLLEHEKWAEKMQTLDGYKEMVNALLSDYSRRGAFNGVINAKNAAQLAKLINNANTSSSLNRALAYLDKMIESKRYSEVISSIRDLKAKIKARIRGQKSAYGNKTDSVLNLLSLKEHQMLIISESGQSQFDLLYQYWAVLDGIANKPVPDFTGYADLYKNISSQYEGIISENYAADEFVDKLDGFDKLWKASQELLAQVANSAPDYISIRKAAGSINRKAYSLYKNGIITKDELKQFLVTLSKNSRSTDINIDEIRQVVEGIEEEAIESIGESLSKSQFHDLFDSISDTAKESVKFLLGEFSSKNVDHVKVLKEMGTDKILLLKSVIDQLFVVSDEDSTPYVSPKLYDLIRDYKVEKGSINILEAIDHAINEKRDAVGSIFARSKDKTRQQIYKSLFRMPAAMIDQALSLGKSGAYWKNVMNDLSSSDSNASIKIRELNRRLYLIMYNRAGVKLGAMSQQSRYRVGIIMKQMDYQANHPDFASLDDERKDAMRYLLERDRNKATYSDSEVKEIQKAYDSLPKHPNGNLDVESALKSLSDREASLIKEMRSMFESDLLPMIQHANELRGEVTESQIDYYPKISRHNDPRYKDEDTTPSQIVSQLETYSIRSSASYSRKNGEIFWTELDPDRVMPRTIEQAAVDSIIGESVYVSLGVLSRSAEKNANISGYKSNMINALYDITRDSIVNHFTVRASNGTWIERAINNANAQARTLLLSDLTRPIKEYPSNYLKYMISEGGVSGIIESLASFSPIERKVMKKIFDRFDAPIMEKANHFTFEGGGDMGREGILRVYANALATMSDSSVAKNVWMNEFKKAFKSLSGNEFDVEAYDTDESYVSKVDDDVKDSVVAANMAVENISGPQSSVSAPYKIGWSRRGSWGAKLFGFMQSYNAFESKVLFENFRDVLSGENSGRGRAMRYVAGVVASNMAYTVLSYVVLNALKDSLSSEDEGDSLLDDVIQAFESMSTKKGATNVFISSLINLAAGGYGWAVKILAGMVYSFGDSILYESGYSKTKEGKAKVDAVKDAIYDYYYFSVMNVSQRGKQDPAINLLNTVPVFSLYALPLANTVVDYGQLAVNKFNGEELGHKEYMSYNLMLATSAMMSYFRLDYPGMATVHKMLKEKSKKPAPVKKAQKGQSVPWFMHVNENPSGEQSMSGSKE